MSDFVQKALAGVRSKLLDLTRRNRLLNYKETARSIRVVDELPDEVFRILVLDEKEMQFLPIQDEAVSLPLLQEVTKHELPQQNGAVAMRHRDTRLQTPFGSTVLERRCKKLLQESRTAIEETGSNLLHLAIGFLEWYESDDSEEVNRAPLILVPVRIDRSRIDHASNCYTYVISYTGEDIETNLSLAEKLNIDFDLILPSLDDEVMPEVYFDGVAATVRKRPRWRVAREIVLGLFSFSKLLMYKDLDPVRWPKGASPLEHSNVKCILAGRCDEKSGEEPYGEEYDIDRDKRAFTLPLITDADSSQTSVIMDVIHHRESLVVEGPPGTGKSQTITNLIAAALHQGLSVLFVAEKKAALEVVRSRLDHAGLGDFCLELHSHKTQKGQLHADISRRLKKSFPDAKTLDRDLSDLGRERDRLMAYSALVNSVVGPNGETIHDIFWAAECCRTELKGQPPRFMIRNALNLTHDQLDERINLLRDVARLRGDLPDEAIRAWEDFEPGTILPGDDEAVAEALDEIIQHVGSFQTLLDDHATTLSWPVTSIDDLRRLCQADGSLLCEMPSDYYADLASALVLPANLKRLEGLADSIADYQRLTNDAEKIVSRIEGEATTESVERIATVASGLQDIGYGSGTPRGLLALIEGQKSGSELLVRLTEAFDTVKPCFVAPLQTLDDDQRLLELQRLMKGIPADTPDDWYAEHALESTSTTLLNARSACEQLRRDLEEHSRFFLLRYLPACSELAELAKGLRGFRGSFFAFLSSKYRELRRTLKAFLVDPKQLSASDVVERIEGLVDTLTSVAEITNNEVFRRKLGPLYVGTETDWSKLEESVVWGQTFSSVVGSQSHAYNLVPRLPELMPAIAAASAIVASTQSDLAPLRELLGVAGTERICDVQVKLLNDSERLRLLLDPLTVQPRLADLDISSIVSASQAFLDAQQLVAILPDNLYRLHFKDAYAGMATDIDRLLRTARWFAQLGDEGKFQVEVLTWLAETDTADRCNLLQSILSANAAFWERYTSLLNRILLYGKFESSSMFWCEGYCDGLDVLVELASECREQVFYLVTWADYRRTLARADALGLEVVTEAIDGERIAPDESAAIYRHAVYDSMARDIIAHHPELAGFTRAEFEGVRERYATIDRQIMKNTRGRIGHIASTRPVPRGVAYGPVKTHTDLALVERELQKQKRHIPIRQLVRRAGRALQGLKPCFMMSPLSVAQYLEPGQITFDLVVMDEASQLKPEDALGAVGRARQLIVVGDPNQLPPTSFFDRTDGVSDDEEASAVQDTESILDICITNYRKRRLRWHYRSEHESLIAFSNYRFYDDDLIIFPSPLGKNSSYGVHLHYIEGATYQKGRNRAEAEAVALAIIAHFRSAPKLSLGVATFNREQAELVLDVLDRLQKQQPWLEQAIKQTENGEEPFFVKNLENVQGDERDVIFVATTYGPDQATGKVYQRFGPIAGDTGWRRLNVIFTRAKKRLELFTSLRAADIKLSDTPTKGTVALKQYLEYAETGLLPDYGSIGGREPDSDFEVAVARHLNEHGFKTVAQVGVSGFFIDLGVLHPERQGEFVLGVECDGAAYHSSKSVRDRDRLRQEILERKGWRIHRIWSTDWFKNREREINRLLAAVRQAVGADTAVAVRNDEFQTAVAAAVASVLPKPEPVAQKSAEKPSVAECVKATKGLREELVEYRQANIAPSFPDEGRGILRDEILDRLVKQMPITTEEFYRVVPMELRQHTDGKQMQFLDDILEIIDAYT